MTDGDKHQGDPLIGRPVGNYVLCEQLGAGGMGAVYLALHPKIGREVAVKVLAPHLSHQPQIAERFLVEARAVARIRHPNVIDIYDFGALDDGRLYYVMELLEGCELRTVLERRRKLSPLELWPYLEQICAGLQAAHDQGIVHRDLKPENIFVVAGKELRVKLLDFGIAKLLESEDGPSRTTTGMVIGTPRYIAPEQAAGKPALVSPRTDLYSLGVILYLALGGRPPFEAEINAILIAMHIADTPRPLRELEPTLPEAIAALVERCLEKEPSRRPASAVALAQAFRAALGATLPIGIVPAPSEACAAPARGGHAVLPEPRETTAATLAAAPAPRETTATLAAAPAALRDRAASLRQEEPTASAVAVAGGEVRDAPPPQHTTLSGTASELVPTTARRGRARAAALAGGLLVLVAAGLLYLRSPPTEPRAPLVGTRTAAADARVPPASAPASAPFERERARLVVTADDQKGVACKLTLEGREPQTQFLPCRFELEPGRGARLEVVKRGYAPFTSEWRVAGDRTLALEVLRGARRIVEPGAAGSAARPGTTRPEAGRSPAKKPEGEVSAEAKRPPERKTRATSPTKQAETKVGEGTMTMED
jgi:serine/threonine-protein kinase